MNRLKLPILLIILILGFTARLYRFDNPIADWHEWRQADTSSVSRNFLNEGFDILHPRFDDLSNVASGMDNPQGYRMVEFPIYNLAQAGLSKTFSFLTLEEWGRMVSILATLSSTILIYLLVKKHSSTRAGLISAFLYSVLPFSVFYGRVILPDPSMVAASLAGVYFFDRFLDSQNKNKWILFVSSLIFTSMAMLLKPYAIIFTLPIVYLAFEKYKLKLLGKWFLWAYLILSILPLIAWRQWILQFPQGIPASDWLFNQGNIRFKGSFFYWIFADRLSRLILGYFGIFLFLSGFVARLAREDLLFFLSFAVSSLSYVTILAAGNVQHDYYQILILPTVVIFAGLGADFLLRLDANRYIKYSLFLVSIFFSIFFSWYFVRDYFNINNQSIIDSGKIIDEITPKDARVIAVYNGDTAFLYQTKRKGWASQEKDMEEMVKLGADYLALSNPVEADFSFAKQYKVTYYSSKLLLYDLHQKP